MSIAIRALGLIALLGVAAPALADTPDLYAESYALEGRGKYTEALKVLDRAPPADQQSYTYQLRRGWLSYLAGAHDAAIESYRAAALLEPRAVEPLLGLMLPQMGSRRWADTIATGKEVLALDKASYLGLSRTAYSLYSLARFAKAEARYREVLALYPADVEMRTGLGWTVLKQGRTADAKRLFREVLAVAPSHASAAQGLGLASR